MLAIRMQRVGRKGHPIYRVIVQEAQRQPTSGRVVAVLGTYDPHTKKAELDKTSAKKYLDNGAQPSDRVVKLFQIEKIDLPKWVEKLDTSKQKAIRKPEKLRRNQPKEESPEEVSEGLVAEPVAEKAADAETPAEVETA